MSLLGNDAGDVFLQFVVVFGRNEALPAFNRKNDVDINLCVRVGHAPNMSLLRSWGNIFLAVLLQILRSSGPKRSAIRFPGDGSYWAFSATNMALSLKLFPTVIPLETAKNL